MSEVRARPMCAVCGHPVERFEEVEHFGRMRLVATCHGEREAVDLEGHEAKGLQFGAAFAHGARRLPEGRSLQGLAPSDHGHDSRAGEVTRMKQPYKAPRLTKVSADDPRVRAMLAEDASPERPAENRPNGERAFRFEMPISSVKKE